MLGYTTYKRHAPMGVRRGEAPAPHAPEAQVERVAWRGGAYVGPATDVVATEAGLVLRLEVPGIPAEAIDISLEDGHLVVTGEKPAAPIADGTAVLRTERRSGAFRRSLLLPEGVDGEHIHADLDRGVLTITLPVTEQTPRRVPITTQAGTAPDAGALTREVAEWAGRVDQLKAKAEEKGEEFQARYHEELTFIGERLDEAKGLVDRLAVAGEEAVASLAHRLEAALKDIRTRFTRIP